MILKGFKEKSTKKYLNAILNARHVNVNNSKIESLGVVLNIDAYRPAERGAGFCNVRFVPEVVVTEYALQLHLWLCQCG